MTTYSIDDQHGTLLCAGLQGYDAAHAAAQRRADDLGQTVYLYEAGTESDSEEVTPIGVTYAYVEHGEQRSAFRACTTEQAIAAAVDHLDAVARDGGYAYRAEETGAWYAVTSEDMADLGAAVLDGRASLSYSLWCAGCGEEIPDPTSVRCECGACTGVRCDWVGDAADTVVIEWMPPSLRASHQVAGNAGAYPHNGARRLTVAQACATSLVESDGEWCTIVETGTPESGGGLTGVATDLGDGAVS